MLCIRAALRRPSACCPGVTRKAVSDPLIAGPAPGGGVWHNLASRGTATTGVWPAAGSEEPSMSQSCSRHPFQKFLGWLEPFEPPDRPGRLIAGGTRRGLLECA